MPVLDPRITPARPDLAAAHLEGRVEAATFVEPVDYQVVAASVPIRKAPGHDAAMDDQLLAGECFAVLEEREGWAWGFSRSDAYVGWVCFLHLTPRVLGVDTRVRSVRTYAFSCPDLKSPPNHLLSLNAKFASGRREGRFVEARGLGWVFIDHCSALNESAPDFVTVAEGFRGAPYLWGGKESLGLDCSGLLQMALEAAGVEVPRDADQQEAVLKSKWLDVTADDERRRGDVVFWPGHVGVMTDATHFLHANAHTMDVALEVFSNTEARIREMENPVRTIVRQP
jgi:hypothetical protein